MKHSTVHRFHGFSVAVGTILAISSFLAGCTSAPAARPTQADVATATLQQPAVAASDTPQPAASSTHTTAPTPLPTQDPSLIGEWHLDGNINDSSGNNNNGKLVNGAYEEGVNGQAVVLSGANSYVEIPDSPSLADGASSALKAITVSLWININNLPAQNMVPLVKEHAFRFVISADGSGHFVIATADNSWYTSGTLANTNTRLWPGDWHHLAATYNGAQIKTYMDGVLKSVSTPKISGIITAHAKPMGRTTTQINNPLRFGFKSSSNIDFMDGKIDEVRIYSRALNGSEIKALYNAYVPPDGPTAIPLPTSTPFTPPEPTATQTTVNVGLPFKDDFSDAASGWEIAGDAGYNNGVYAITVSDPQVFLWALARRAPLANYHMQVTARNTQSVAGASFGMVCNYQDDANFYFLGIGSDGRYAIIKILQGQPVYLSSAKAEWLASDKIPANAESYDIGVTCASGNLTLMVNGQTVASVQDSAFTQGDVGLAAMNDQAAPSVISFDNFTLEAAGQ